MFAIAASVVVLSHISTTPAWCGVAESQLPLPMTRVRSFLADLRSRDPVERQCARANLDRLIHQLRSGAAPGLIEGDVEQARAELRLGLVRAYLDGALRQDVTQFFSDFSSVLECTSTCVGLGCAGLVALQLELDVSRHGRVTRVAVSPPTHRGAGCVRRALTQARFAPASIDVRVAIPWVVTPRPQRPRRPRSTRASPSSAMPSSACLGRT